MRQDLDIDLIFPIKDDVSAWLMYLKAELLFEAGGIDSDELSAVLERGAAALDRATNRAAEFPPRRLPPRPRRLAAWDLRRIGGMSTRVGGSFKPISSIVSAMICDIARLRNHLWFAVMTYQGARFVLVQRKASSYASRYAGQSPRSE